MYVVSCRLTLGSLLVALKRLVYGSTLEFFRNVSCTGCDISLNGVIPWKHPYTTHLWLRIISSGPNLQPPYINQKKKKKNAFFLSRSRHASSWLGKKKNRKLGSNDAAQARLTRQRPELRRNVVFVFATTFVGRPKTNLVLEFEGQGSFLSTWNVPYRKAPFILCLFVFFRINSHG